jgi:aminoglycoside phosphotransferase (APT) family kinase protein
MFTAGDDMEGTSTVAEDDRLDLDRLATWLAPLVPIAGPLTALRFKGGQSNPTYLIEDRVGRRFVLRRKPTGALLRSAHQVEREYRVLSTLADSGLPLPRVHGLCEDANVFGPAFYVMDFVPGRIFWDQTMPGAAPTDRRAIYTAMIDTLASLHRLDFGAYGLADLGDADGYVRRQVARWTKQYRLSGGGQLDVMEEVIDWVTRHAPEGGAPALIHGDFRLDNLIFAPDEPRVIAILDWEISTIGDPLADLAFQVFPLWLPPDLLNGLDRADRANLGIPSEAEQLARYATMSGRPVGETWPLYRIYTLFRLAAIFQGIEGRVRKGTNANPRARGLLGKVEPLARLAAIHIEQWEARRE